MASTEAAQPGSRARGLGVRIGRLEPGPENAITDVAGVRVGHATIVRGDGALRVGAGPVRTGVTVVAPPGELWPRPVFAGCHRLNGNGELTGLEWIREAGLLTSPVAITNTHSVGLVRDTLIAIEREARGADAPLWSLPVVGETWDGVLNDIDGFHVTAEHVREAWGAASGGPVAEGNVGGGTGMICHGFKGGIGTASRRLGVTDGGYTVGVLVQANHGRRPRLAVAGVPVGEEIGPEVVPLPAAPARVPPGAGSIIVVVATDAPLLPHQCARLAQRPALGIGRSGGAGEPSSGDLVIAFATGNRAVDLAVPGDEPAYRVDALRDDRLGPLFWAAIEATEEAIVNALVAAETMSGRDGVVAHALPHDRLTAALVRFGRR
jgi:D-aminopeptidase